MGVNDDTTASRSGGEVVTRHALPPQLEQGFYGRRIDIPVRRGWKEAVGRQGRQPPFFIHGKDVGARPGPLRRRGLA